MKRDDIVYKRLENIQTFGALKLYKNVLTPLAYRYCQMSLKRDLKRYGRITFMDFESILLDELPRIMHKRLTK
jgi:hypothetical protein